jgi:hypothetical protein
MIQSEHDETYRVLSKCPSRTASSSPLEVSRDRLAATSFRLWDGRTFAEERHHRAGSDANAQKRGRVTRELRAELEEALADGDD